MNLSKNELESVKGGAITAALVSAITNAAEFIFDIGASVGRFIQNKIYGFSYKC